jgi:hypothetical protein
MEFHEGFAVFGPCRPAAKFGKLEDDVFWIVFHGNPFLKVLLVYYNFREFDSNLKNKA